MFNLFLFNVFTRCRSPGSWSWHFATIFLLNWSLFCGLATVVTWLLGWLLGGSDGFVVDSHSGHGFGLLLDFSIGLLGLGLVSGSCSGLRWRAHLLLLMVLLFRLELLLSFDFAVDLAIILVFLLVFLVKHLVLLLLLFLLLLLIAAVFHHHLSIVVNLLLVLCFATVLDDLLLLLFFFLLLLLLFLVFFPRLVEFLDSI